jgi:hypothetical protein
MEQIDAYHDRNTISLLWNRLRYVPYTDPGVERLDPMDRRIRLNEYGNRRSAFGFEIDHILPQSCGGGHNIENLQLLHWELNKKYGNRLVDKYGRRKSGVTDEMIARCREEDEEYQRYNYGEQEEQEQEEEEEEEEDEDSDYDPEEDEEEEDEEDEDEEEEDEEEEDEEEDEEFPDEEEEDLPDERNRAEPDRFANMRFLNGHEDPWDQGFNGHDHLPAVH